MKEKNMLFFCSLIMIIGCWVLDQKGAIHFVIDMKNVDYSSPLLTFGIPICFFFVLQMIAHALAKVRGIGSMIATVGNVSLIIMYTHIPVRELLVKKIWGETYSIAVFVIVSILVALGLERLIRKNKILIRMLIGKRG